VPTRSAPAVTRRWDPIGFALESFDGIGTEEELRRTALRSTVRHALQRRDVDGISAPPEPRRGTGVFVGVMTEKLLTYALGRGLDYYEHAAVRKIVADGRTRIFRFSSIRAWASCGARRFR